MVRFSSKFFAPSSLHIWWTNNQFCFRMSTLLWKLNLPYQIYLIHCPTFITCFRYLLYWHGILQMTPYTFMVFVVALFIWYVIFCSPSPRRKPSSSILWTALRIAFHDPSVYCSNVIDFWHAFSFCVGMSEVLCVRVAGEMKIPASLTIPLSCFLEERLSWHSFAHRNFIGMIHSFKNTGSLDMYMCIL